MFKEIAIDPHAVVRSYRDFVYVIEKFGLHQGRLIAQFPSKWKKMAYEAARQRHRGKVELNRIELRLKKLDEDVLWSSGRPGGDPSAPWLQRVSDEHEQRPFDAIVVEGGEQEMPFVPLDLLYEQHPCLAPNHQWVVNRKAEVLADACRFHLATAKHVKLIDPHFDLATRRFRRPFEALLSATGANRPQVDIYRSLDPKFDAGDWVERMAKFASAAAMRGFNVRLFLFPGLMHNRYVLTDRGGVMFGTGLDDDNDGNGNPTDDLILLDRPVWEEKWAGYALSVPTAEWPSQNTTSYSLDPR
jgi:hypothetical protein